MTGPTVLVLALVTLSLLVVLWNVTRWPRLVPVSSFMPMAAHERVSVLIPARDEAATIVECIVSVLDQREAVFEVLVYDDRSTDTTAARVRRITETDHRVQLLTGGALAQGWYGKPHACDQLAAAAGGDWLLFLDADARLHPGAIGALLREARARDITFLSAWPGMEMKSTAERVLMPLLNLLVFSVYPAPLSLVRRDPSLGLAHGACIFAHGATYRRVGGHGAVRRELFEDSRLAQVWRERGERGLCLDGQDLVAVRMYHSLSEIWSGFQKNFYPAFRRDLTFWAFLVLHVTTFLAPFLLVAWFASLKATPPWAVTLAVGGVLAIRLLLAARFHHPLWSVLAHPLAEVVLIGIALASWWRCRSGRGVVWKGRTYRALGGGGKA